jgi:hypothetical protein
MKTLALTALAAALFASSALASFVAYANGTAQVAVSVKGGAPTTAPADT